MHMEYFQSSFLFFIGNPIIIKFSFFGLKNMLRAFVRLLKRSSL